MKLVLKRTTSGIRLPSPRLNWQFRLSALPFTKYTIEEKLQIIIQL